MRSEQAADSSEQTTTENRPTYIDPASDEFRLPDALAQQEKQRRVMVTITGMSAANYQLAWRVEPAEG